MASAGTAARTGDTAAKPVRSVRGVKLLAFSIVCSICIHQSRRLRHSALTVMICSVISLDKRVYQSSRAGRERLAILHEAGSLRFHLCSAPRVPRCHARAWQTIPHLAMAARCREAPTGAGKASRDRPLPVRRTLLAVAARQRAPLAATERRRAPEGRHGTGRSRAPGLCLR